MLTTIRLNHKKNSPIIEKIKPNGTSNKLVATLLHHVLNSGVLLRLVGKTNGVNKLSKRSLHAEIPKITDIIFGNDFIIWSNVKGKIRLFVIGIAAIPWVNMNWYVANYGK